MLVWSRRLSILKGLPEVFIHQRFIRTGRSWGVGTLTWNFKLQLGHLRTDDKTISAPKLVSAFTDKRIRDISTSDAAIVVLTENGDVVAIQDFASKRILSTKQFDVVKMVAVGGHLDSKTIPNLDLVRHFFSLTQILPLLREYLSF